MSSALWNTVAGKADTRDELSPLESQAGVQGDRARVILTDSPSCWVRDRDQTLSPMRREGGGTGRVFINCELIGASP